MPWGYILLGLLLTLFGGHAPQARAGVYERPRMPRRPWWIGALRAVAWTAVGLMLAFCLWGAVMLFVPLPD